MPNNLTHLTVIPGATVLVWHTEEDIQAVRVAGIEYLIVDGHRVALTDNDYHATQSVINYCGGNKRMQKAFRNLWKERGEFKP